MVGKQAERQDTTPTVIVIAVAAKTGEEVAKQTTTTTMTMGVKVRVQTVRSSYPPVLIGMATVLMRLRGATSWQ